MIYTDNVHLVSDSSLKELHEFAKKVGIKRCWFHSGSRWPHYDIPKGRRETLAIEYGIAVVTSREIIKILKGKDE
jgi:hypothetical protein